jgi:hypothetical protein
MKPQPGSVIFRGTAHAMKNDHPEQFQLIHIFSREKWMHPFLRQD